MAILTAAKREDLRKKDFSGPHRSFPIPDHEHARLALQFVGRSEAAGHITPEEAEHIRAEAHAKLHEHHTKMAKALREHREERHDRPERD